MRRLAVVLMATLLAAACSTNEIEYLGDSELIDGSDDGRIVLTDADGIEYDITHAVTHYGFDPDRFRGGAGLDRFRPYVDARFAEPGTRSYPAPFDDMDVIAFEMNGETRAYALDDLTGIEIVDDVVGDAHIAVGW